MASTIKAVSGKLLERTKLETIFTVLTACGITSCNGKRVRRMSYAERISGLWHIVSALEGKLMQFPLFNEVL